MCTLRNTFCIPYASSPSSNSRIKKELTVTDADGNVQCLYGETKQALYVPRYYGLKRWTPQTVDLSFGDIIEPDRCRLEAKLVEERKRQVSSTRECLRQFGQSKGCILRMPCGFGKTVCALFLVSQCAHKTLYLVQADDLLKQTVGAVQKYLPGVCVGVAQGPPKTWDRDADVVVAMVQTLYAHRTELDIAWSRRFGFVIVDECHHIGAPTFCTVLQKFSPRWMLGLTATPSRMDDKTKWIEWMIGPIVNVFDDESQQRPDIHVIWSPSLPTSFPSTHLNHTLRFPKSNTDFVMLHTLAQWDKRRRDAQIDFLIKHLPTCLTGSQPIVVIFGERILQLCMLSYELLRRLQPNVYHQDMHQFTQQNAFHNVGSTSDYYRQCNKTMRKHWREVEVSYLTYINHLDSPVRVLRGGAGSMNRPILFATIRKLGEGIDVDSLEMVCLTSSISANNMAQFAQVIGRLREKEGVTKTILDFTDCYPFFQRQGNKRREYYVSRGMNILP